MIIRKLDIFRTTTVDRSWKIHHNEEGHGYDYRHGLYDYFICSTEFNERFPHLRHAKSLTMTVTSHSVKGSKMFIISRPHAIMHFTKGIAGVNNMYGKMRAFIDRILDQCEKERMRVWVTFE